jgi:DNA-binding MarR family transcriptional regulator
MCSTGAMTNGLDRLEESGYLRREYGTADRRSVLLVITADGQKIATRAKEARGALYRDLLPGLSMSERKALAGMLQRMLTEFEQSHTTFRQVTCRSGAS